MAVGLDALDRLDPEQGDRPVRAAVNRVVAVSVAVGAKLADPRPLERSLGTPPGDALSLEHAAIHWPPILPDEDVRYVDHRVRSALGNVEDEHDADLLRT